MDIEGAEYTIVPHLLKMGAYINIDHLLVEYHPNLALNKESIRDTEECIKKMVEFGVQVPEYSSAA